MTPSAANPTESIDGSSANKRFAVLGSPIDHSLSPVLHTAAFNALGLNDASYERLECSNADHFLELLSSSDPLWTGFSVTMPCKPFALQFADLVTERSQLVNSANTLVRREDQWQADCTDIDGATGAIRELLVGGQCSADQYSAVVLGAGATARPVIAALAELGFTELVIATRRDSAAESVALAQQLGMIVRSILLEDTELPGWLKAAAVVVSTIPAPAADAYAALLARAPRVLDVVYHPWPTKIARAVNDAGGQCIGGDRMLLYQAFGQCEQFTGRPAPRSAMETALVHALRQ